MAIIISKISGYILADTGLTFARNFLGVNITVATSLMKDIYYKFKKMKP